MHLSCLVATDSSVNCQSFQKYFIISKEDKFHPIFQDCLSISIHNNDMDVTKIKGNMVPVNSMRIGVGMSIDTNEQNNLMSCWHLFPHE